jgi:8-oxo-dGTP diphosphatase
MDGTDVGERDDRNRIGQAVRTVPMVVVAARNARGDLLLVRGRCGSRAWQLPGGRVEDAAGLGRAGILATVEETGVWVRVTGLVGLFSEPDRPFVVCLHAWAVAGEPRAGGTAIWVAPDTLATLELDPGAARWAGYALSGAADPHVD